MILLQTKYLKCLFENKVCGKHFNVKKYSNNNFYLGFHFKVLCKFVTKCWRYRWWYWQGWRWNEVVEVVFLKIICKVLWMFLNKCYLLFNLINYYKTLKAFWEEFWKRFIIVLIYIRINKGRLWEKVYFTN